MEEEKDIREALKKLKDEHNKGGAKVLAVTLLKMLSVLTPEELKQLKVAGYADEVKAMLGHLEMLAVSWRWRFGGQIDIKVWADVQVKLNQLRATLETAS